MDMSCRQCKAGMAQAVNSLIGWHCAEHGQGTLDVSHFVRESKRAAELEYECEGLRQQVSALSGMLASESRQCEEYKQALSEALKRRGDTE